VHSNRPFWLIYIHTYIYMFTYTYIHITYKYIYNTHIYKHLQTHICTNLYDSPRSVLIQVHSNRPFWLICIHTYIYMFTYTYIHIIYKYIYNTHIYKHLQTCIYTNLYDSPRSVLIQVHLNRPFLLIYIHTYIYIYVYIYIYTYNIQIHI
jgi:hypothetical protein